MIIEQMSEEEESNVLRYIFEACLPDEGADEIVSPSLKQDQRTKV